MLYEYLLFSIGGLLLGSSLHILARNLPVYLYDSWKIQCESFLLSQAISRSSSLKFTLSCPHCQQPYPMSQYFSWLHLILNRLQCSHCKHALGILGLILEFLSCCLIILTLWHFGLTLKALCCALFLSTLLLAATIDCYHLILPDCIVLPLLWAGLMLNTTAVFTHSNDAIWGAILGYGSLWSLAWIFSCVRHQEGIGQGDMKLLAALGSWLGATSLVPIILTASSLGILVGLVHILSSSQDYKKPIPFGPFLAIAACLIIFVPIAFQRL